MARKTRSTSKKQDDKTKTEAATDAPETAAADSKTPATPATAETASPATGDAAQPMLVINGQYIKDLSFEVPNAPAVFTQTGTPPEIPINIDVKARNVQANVFEVV
ncbi:MAG: protein-export chaperone SecB, partial [Rhodospirillales bacterium]